MCAARYTVNSDTKFANKHPLYNYNTFAKIKLLIYFLLMPKYDSAEIPISRKEDLKLCTRHREIDIVFAPHYLPRLEGRY